MKKWFLCTLLNLAALLHADIHVVDSLSPIENALKDCDAKTLIVLNVGETLALDAEECGAKVLTLSKMSEKRFAQIVKKLSFQPEKIIFVDDRFEQIKRIDAVCRDMQIPSLVFHLVTAKSIQK